MSTQDMANELVALCNQGQNTDAIDKHYSPAIVSLEVAEPMMESHGIDAVRAKNQWWVDNHEVHSASSQGPWVNGDQFVVEHNFDITQKATGQRFQMKRVRPVFGRGRQDRSREVLL
jgi:hypothetical protein